MRKFSVVFAVALAMVLGSYAMAKDAAAKPLHGKVTALSKDADGKVTSITVSHGKKGETPVDTVVKADESTKISKSDGSAATLADVVVGSPVNVTLGDEGKPVASIEIRVKKAK
jgi:hypothetical protein